MNSKDSIETRVNNLITRRKFIVGSMLALGAIGSSVALFLGSDDKDSNEKSRTNNENQNSFSWNFLNPRDVPNIMIKENPMEGYTPFGPNILLSKKAEDYQYVLSRIQNGLVRAIEQKGYDIGRKYDLKMFRQYYGVPLNSSEAEEMKKYIEIATEFLNEKVNGLEIPEIKYTTLSSAGNYEEDFASRAFLVDSTFFFYTTKMTNLDKPSQSFEYPFARHFAGALVEHVKSPTGDLVWYIIYAAGPTALNAPFSEVIPLATFDKRMEYVAQFGVDKASQADEAISEGISYFLTLELCSKLQVPRFKQIVEQAALGLKDPRYRYVDNAKKLVLEIGVQPAFDLYMENPKDFMQKIGAI